MNECQDRSALVIKVTQFGRRVYGWIEHQDESLRAFADANKSILIVECEALRLETWCNPGLQRNDNGKAVLYIRGKRTDRDDRGFDGVYESEETATMIVEAIGSCVTRINAGFNASEGRLEMVEVKTFGNE